MKKGEGQACPAIWPSRSCGVAISGEAQTGKAEDAGLPDSTAAGIVDTLWGVPSEIFQVNQGSFHEEVVGSLGLTYLATENSMERRGKRRTVIMVGDGIVVVPIDSLGLYVKARVKKGEEHQYVGLLHNRAFLHSVHAKNSL